MKYLCKFKIFENKIDIEPENYVDDYLSVHELHTEGQAILNINKLIKKVESIEYPFEAFLLEDDNTWTTDISNINNYYPGNSYIKKVIVNEEDLDVDQTIRGRILELDYKSMFNSHYVSFNKELNSEEVTLDILSEIKEYSYPLSDDNINVLYSLIFSSGEKKDMNILTIVLERKNGLLPIDDTLDFLYRFDRFIKDEWGFTEHRPSHLNGRIDANIHLQSHLASDFLSLSELEKKSNSFSVNLPFRELTITYFKYLQ